MKMPRIAFILAAIAGGVSSASAQLTIPGDGSDGALNITANTVIDLAQAPDGTWSQNNSSNTGKGVYDSAKWAVVFKYSSVNIASGATLTFTNHRTHAPVVWLVQGNVTINGTLDLRGKDAATNPAEALLPAEPGPGGFRGGAKGPSGSGSGYGPSEGYHASKYGNPQIMPLIGGSGFPDSRSAGGGVILIASPGTVSITGNILATGGLYPDYGWHKAAGGAVRIIASSVTGTGSIDATRDGRIRIETNSLAPSLATAPETIGVPPANPPLIWPAANTPKVRVASVDAVNAPADPSSPLIASADVAIQNNEPVHIILETTNFPIEGAVELYVIPKFGARTTYTATRIGGTPAQATWRVTTKLPQGFVVLQARATLQ